MTLLSRALATDEAVASLQAAQDVVACLQAADGGSTETPSPGTTPPGTTAPGTTPLMTARPMSGIGLAMRQGDLILACTETGVGAVVSAFADVVAAGGDGMMLVRRIAAILADDFAGEVVACAACGPTRDGRLAVLVYGGARALIDADESPTLAGDQDVAAVCRLLPQPIGALRLELPGAAAPDPRTRLDVGVVVAAGVSITFTGGLPTPPAAVPAPPPRPKPRTAAPPIPVNVVSGRPATDHSHDTQHVDVSHGRQPAGHTRGEPPAAWGGTSEHPLVPRPVHPGGPPMRLPAVARPHTPAPNGRPAPSHNGSEPRPPAPVVRGLGCAVGHFNDPRLAYCAVCGTSMTAASSHEREGPRPPLGVLLLDLGGTFVLDGDIIIGREPEVDHDVTSGLARPLILDEPAQRVSRRHARIIVIDWDVFVVDLGSTNGTRLQRPGESPMRIPLQALTPITPGTIIWLADRWLRYESNRDPQGPADGPGTR
jgi:hypothetical protein